MDWSEIIKNRNAKWDAMKAELEVSGIHRIDIWKGNQHKYTHKDGFRAGLYLLPVHKDCKRGVIIVCAGGGFMFKSPNEAKPVAEFFHEAGFNAAILDYSVDSSSRLDLYNPPEVRLAAGQDALRAVRYLRYNADKLGIKANRIAVGGFSAGGQTTQLAATRFDYGDPCAEDELDRASSRPDAALLMYGARSYTSIINPGISAYDAENWQKLCHIDPIRNIRPDCPPFFIFQTNKDDPRFGLMLALELTSKGVPHEIHTFENGPHGAGLYNGCDSDTPYFRHTAKWAELAASWLEERGF